MALSTQFGTHCGWTSSGWSVANAAGFCGNRVLLDAIESDATYLAWVSRVDFDHRRTLVVPTDNVQVGRQALAGVIPEQFGSGISYILLRSSGKGICNADTRGGEWVRASLARKSTFYTSDEKCLVGLWLVSRRRGTQAHVTGHSTCCGR